MAEIRPFPAIRPAKGYEEKIAALPYDVYNRAEAKEEVKAEPLSFLGIDRAEVWFEDSVDTYADCVYEKAGNLLQEQITKGYFQAEETPCYYIYELTMDGRVQTGIGAVASVDDYLNAVIKRHENTRQDKEEDRIRHVRACNAQTGPIFLAYRKRELISALVGSYKEEMEPIYDFVSKDGVGHRLWRIDEMELIEELYQEFQSMEAVYIADGHHRCASAVQNALRLRKEQPEYTKEEPWNYFLCVLFPDEELKILDYNRVVKDLNGFDKKQFLEKISQKFQVKYVGKEACRPGKKGFFGMCLKDGWYELSVLEEYISDDPVDGLDVSLLQNYLLDPILGIKNPREDNRIEFVGGIRGLTALEERVQKTGGVAFSMYPTAIEELFAVADADRLMPPKSTWFEPKLRSGFLLHSLGEK